MRPGNLLIKYIVNYTSSIYNPLCYHDIQYCFNLDSLLKISNIKILLVSSGKWYLGIINRLKSVQHNSNGTSVW